MGKVLLEMKNISKTFPGVKALDNVEFRIYEGEAMGFLGENGAGKSTLMKILSGIYSKDEGEIIFDGHPFDVSTPKEAIDSGIAIIHQEFNLVNNMNIYENIYLGREIVKSGRLDKKTMYDKSKELLAKLDIHLDPSTIVGKLSLAQMQMVEIARALSMNAKIIIMDEPTDALTSREVDKLFNVIEQLKKDKKGIVYISHRLEEISRICDKFIVLRDGKYIGERNVLESSEEEIIAMMVGRDLEDYIPYKCTADGEVSLEVKDVENDYVSGISFNVKHGEILGIAGLVGAGRTELAKTIYGHYPIRKGNIYLNGKELTLKNEKDGIDNGIVYVSEDRKRDGLILNMDVCKNMTLSSLSQLIENGKINNKRELEVVNQYIKDMNIKTPSSSQIIENLSGGNQQKVAIAKGLMTNPDVLILDEPTRGVDVGAKSEIYELLNGIKEQGKAIIVISSDMPEILGLSDRILVINEGKVKGELLREEASQEKIMELIVQGGKINEEK